jgi:secreted trypsin-like serine protease
MAPQPKLSLALALLVAALAAAPAGAVSGGTALPIAQAPYLAWFGGHCTGTLISPTRILTAGHCLDGHSATDAEVIVGSDGNLLTLKQRKAAAVAVRGYSVFSKFKESFPFAHRAPENAIAVEDVGLILLEHPITTIKPVRVAGAGDAALEAPGTAATLIGYGETAPEPTIGAIAVAPLQQGALAVIGASACVQAYPHAIRSSMLCTQDPLQHQPLIQACAGDSGGPTIVATPSGPVQIGVTSWGPEVMEGLCGEKSLPQVTMRASAFTAFITAAKPVIEPFAKGSDAAAASHIAGTARVGRTVTCNPPKLGGDPFTLSYSWQLAQNEKIVTLRGEHKRTLTITSALYRRALAPKEIFCTATAHNAGGSLPSFSESARLKKR